MGSRPVLHTAIHFCCWPGLAFIRRISRTDRAQRRTAETSWCTTTMTRIARSSMARSSPVFRTTTSTWNTCAVSLSACLRNGGIEHGVIPTQAGRTRHRSRFTHHDYASRLTIHDSTHGSRMIIHPIILSGGSRTRLWPLSREHYPKQLLPLYGQETLLQQTIMRIGNLKGASPRS